MTNETNENGFQRFTFKQVSEFIDILMEYDLFDDKSEALEFVSQLEQSYSFHNPNQVLYWSDPISKEIYMNTSWKTFYQAWLLGFASGVQSLSQTETNSLH